ncbi:MAG: glycosyltransferase family 4 protein [Anaerolineae bacterium]
MSALVRYVLDARAATSHFPGIGRYVINLARAMTPLLGGDERLVLLRDPTQLSPWDLKALAGERVQVIDVPLSPFSPRQQWGIPRLLRRCQAGLYHSPYYSMPYLPGVPTVLTVYDLIPLRYPQYVSAQARLLFRWMTALALRAAAYVIAISQVTRRDLLTTYHPPSERVTAIPLAADPAFRPQSPEAVTALRVRLNLPDQYVLYLGINKPHKNLVRLIEAWAAISYQLVVAGYWDPRYPQAQERARQLSLEGCVRFLGPVAEEDLPALYSGATCFVFPSLYEGFGLPVLEAMSCGAPVVCSDTSSLPEIVGGAALTFDPLDVTEMAAKIEEALGDEALRGEMREQGLRQAAKFSWERTARETLRVYREAAS